MTRTQIRLDTLTDVNSFVAAMSRINEPVYLEDGAGIKVSAKSALGVLYSMEFTHIYCYCEKDISAHLMPWAV